MTGAALPPLTDGMLEFYLAANGNPLFMPYPADAASQANLASLSVFEVEFQQTLPNKFGSGYQGLFFLPQLAPISADCAAYPVVAYP
jgi:hypothetical protein